MCASLRLSTARHFKHEALSCLNQTNNNKMTKSDVGIIASPPPLHSSWIRCRVSNESRHSCTVLPPHGATRLHDAAGWVHVPTLIWKEVYSAPQTCFTRDSQRLPLQFKPVLVSPSTLKRLGGSVVRERGWIPGYQFQSPLSH